MSRVLSALTERVLDIIVIVYHVVSFMYLFLSLPRCHALQRTVSKSNIITEALYDYTFLRLLDYFWPQFPEWLRAGGGRVLLSDLW